MEAAIEIGFFQPSCFVLDNAAYHVGGENIVLKNWLWTTHGIFLLLLPPRCPELNPTKQVWKMLVNLSIPFDLSSECS